MDIALWAHEHEYQRMWPVYNRTVYNGSVSQPYVDPKATVHLITGSAVSQHTDVLLARCYLFNVYWKIIVLLFSLAAAVSVTKILLLYTLGATKCIVRWSYRNHILANFDFCDTQLFREFLQ